MAFGSMVVAAQRARARRPLRMTAWPAPLHLPFNSTLSRSRHFRSISIIGDRQRHMSAFPRRISPEVCSEFPYLPIRGRKECRAPDAPAAACASV
jgi:hypothetical protein